MDAITVFRDEGGWFWTLQQGDEPLGRSPTYPTRELALASARSARTAAAHADLRIDPAAQDD